MRYLTTESLEPTETGETKGYRLSKASLPLHYKDKITHVPAFYNMDFEMQVGADMKNNLKLVNLEFDSKIEVV
jgi:hypothetical protein